MNCYYMQEHGWASQYTEWKNTGIIYSHKIQKRAKLNYSNQDYTLGKTIKKSQEVISMSIRTVVNLGGGSRDIDWEGVQKNLLESW